MSYPTNDITTTHLDSPTDSIGLARAELYNALVRLGELIDSRDTADGLCPLDSNQQVPQLNMPTTFTSGGTNNIIMQPATGLVVIQDCLALNDLTVAELEALDYPAGTIAYCSDGDAGSACIAVSQGIYDSGNAKYLWDRISLGAVISAS